MREPVRTAMTSNVSSAVKELLKDTATTNVNVGDTPTGREDGGALKLLQALVDALDVEILDGSRKSKLV